MSALKAHLHEAKRGALIKDQHEDEAIAYKRGVDALTLPFMELDRELLLSNQLSEPAGGGDRARGEAGERRGVYARRISALRDELTVFIDHKDRPRVCPVIEGVTDCLDRFNVLCIEDKWALHALNPSEIASLGAAYAPSAARSAHTITERPSTLKGDRLLSVVFVTSKQPSI